MIWFYSLQDLYLRSQIISTKYSNDERIQLYLNDLETIHKIFQEDIKKIFKFSYILGEQTELFIKDINDLQRNEVNNDVIEAFNKFDKSIMITI